MKTPLVAGLGSHHGDDQAGWLVLERLSERHYPRSRLVKLLHPADLLDVIEEEQSVIVCDACTVMSGASLTPDCAAIHRFHWPTDKLTYQSASGSHDLSLGTVLELVQGLGALKAGVDIWVVEGVNWKAATVPSTAVQQAATQIADTIAECYCHA